MTSVFCTSTITPDGGVDARDFFDGEDGFEELGSAAAVLLGNFDAHQAELEELVDQVFIEDALLVHLLDQGTNFLVGELADVVAEENFVFGKGGEGSGNGGLQRGFRHGDTFEGLGWQTRNFSTLGREGFWDGAEHFAGAVVIQAIESIPAGAAVPANRKRSGK